MFLGVRVNQGNLIADGSQLGLPRAVVGVEGVGEHMVIYPVLDRLDSLFYSCRHTGGAQCDF